MKTILILAFLFFHPRPDSFAQSCGCSDELSTLIKKTEANYAGYHLEVKENNKRRYDRLLRKLVIDASTTSFGDCYFILQRYTNYFKDGHLGVIELPAFTALQADSLSALIEQSSLTETSAKAYFIANKHRLDPVEGIWKDAVYTIAIVKEGTIFKGIVLTSTQTKWKPGYVKMILTPKKDTYETLLWTTKFFKQHTVSAVFKKVLLSAGAMQLAKIFPAEPGLAYVNQNNPSLPTFTQLDKDNVLLGLPSFLINGTYLDSLLKQHADAIVSTKNLLIDLRGNQGGNFVYGGLIKFIMDTDTLRTPAAKILSSPDNIKYHEVFYVKPAEQLGKPVPEYITSLLKRMEEHPGQIIDYFTFPQYPMEKATARPVNVAILTDKANLSAAEAFLRYSKQSKKVKQFGTSTKGVLDYMNTNTVRLACTSPYYYMYYPVYFDAGLPLTAINNKGISPDVYSRKEGNELIEFVVNFYKQ